MTQRGSPMILVSARPPLTVHLFHGQDFKMRFDRAAKILTLVLIPLLAAGQGVTDQNQSAGIFRTQVGNLVVTALSDGTAPQDLHTVMTNTTVKEVDRLLRRSFLANPVETSINAYLIETGSRLVLVDAGAGRLFGPGVGGKLIASLAAAGYRPEQIDDILITHVHTDHSGGLVERGRMAFPNAVIHLGQPDLDFFLNPANASRAEYPRRFFEEAEASLRPYLRAGRVRAFTGPTRIMAGITAIPTPGHTPGHTVFRVENGGDSIEFWGDILHFAAVQLPRPAITVTYDVDSPAAAAQRGRQFARAARERRRIAVAHLNFPGIGNLAAAAAGGYIWVPVEYRNRARPPR